jgi:hypothetical protein
MERKKEKKEKKNKGKKKKLGEKQIITEAYWRKEGRTGYESEKNRTIGGGGREK